MRPRLPGLRQVVVLDGAGPQGEVDRGAGLRAWYAGRPEGDLDPGTGPDDAVVQIYTSGTTGLPKGAVAGPRASSPCRRRCASREAWIDWLPQDVSLISLPGLGIAGIGWFLLGFGPALPTS